MKNRKETFIILTPGFASSEKDTNCLPMQQYFVRTINELYPNLQVIILSFQYPYFKKSYQWFGATVISFAGKNKGGISRFLLRNEINRTLKNLHNENNIIGLLSFWYGECAAVGKKFGSKYGIKHFCWLLGQDAKKENKYPGRISLKGDELIALSDFLQKEFERNHGVKPLFVIPPGVDEKQSSSSSERDIDVLGVGSLIPLKQYQILIEMVADLKQLDSKIKILLVGDGSEKEKLETLINQYGLQTTIHLTGELPHDEVLQLMQRTKVFLHPSSYEGFSGVCMEALSAGAHVISFCKPMKNDIEQWHIVNTKDEMEQKAIERLQNSNTVYKQVIVFEMKETVRKMMQLFNA